MMRKSPVGIRRRDFINGVLVGTGGALGAQLLSGCPRHSIPPAGPRHDVAPGLCDGGLGLDPRALRGGNVPSTFNVGHWLRDGRLTWSQSSVSVSPLSCDDVSGSHPIADDD